MRVGCPGVGYLWGLVSRVLAVYKEWMQGGWLLIRDDARVGCLWGGMPGVGCPWGGARGLAVYEGVPVGWLPMEGCKRGCLPMTMRGCTPGSCLPMWGMPVVGYLYGGIPRVGCLWRGARGVVCLWGGVRKGVACLCGGTLGNLSSPQYQPNQMCCTAGEGLLTWCAGLWARAQPCCQNR